MLHRLRTGVWQLSDSTVEIVEDLFKSEAAEEVGKESWDVGKVKEGVVKGGEGWHGQGCLGTGKWKVVRTEMDANGVCRSCGEKLVCIDIDPKETENFAASFAILACEREPRAAFMHFKEWLQGHGPFDAVIDEANIGLVKLQSFSFFQHNNVLRRLQDMSPSKRLPLIVLHQGRVHGGPADNPSKRWLLDFWQRSGALYATAGSNDDW
ncbi:Protein-only RNase P, C-terminal [Dillenia turbinata]|uniref:ribonuclease P n=1 Tax=Dillenia turbinata TaxID=194707 RepID=A0AAN8UNL3_9MAGN